MFLHRELLCVEQEKSIAVAQCAWTAAVVDRFISSLGKLQQVKMRWRAWFSNKIITSKQHFLTFPLDHTWVYIVEYID